MLSTTLRFLHDRGRVIEAHRLIVEERGVERGRVMTVELGAGVAEEREARAVRLGKPVERERRDRMHDLLRRLAGDSLARHALAQLDLDLAHALLAAFEAEGAAQLFRFGPG